MKLKMFKNCDIEFAIKKEVYVIQSQYLLHCTSIIFHFFLSICKE